jgi:hypothetical protein
MGLEILGSIPRIESARGQRGVINAAQALEVIPAAAGSSELRRILDELV